MPVQVLPPADSNPDSSQGLMNVLLEQSSSSGLKRQYKRVVDDAPRLFAGRGDIEAWHIDKGKQTLRCGIFDDADHLPRGENSMFIIRQLSSWDPLQSSLHRVLSLLTACTASPAILDVIQAFGAKVTAEDDPYYNFKSFISTPSPSEHGNGQIEICYLLRSYENHGRTNLKDPWSLRQMAVYQKYDLDTSRSIWILINPFQRLRDNLKQEFLSSGSDTPLALHAFLLDVEASTWRWHLNDFRRSILEFTEKATRSSLKTRPVDYNTNFTDCQRLRRASERLSIAQEVLAANSAAVSTIVDASRHLKDSSPRMPMEAAKVVANKLDNYVRKIDSFSSAAAAIQRQIIGVEALLSQFLSHQKADLLNDHMAALRTLTAQMHDQNAILRGFSEKQARDSRSVKIMTLVAAVYLPANLIAQIFSTPLIQLSEDTNPPRLLSIHRAIWIYALGSILLGLLTVTSINLLGRERQKQKYP